jgi:hypothetical protein
MSDMALVPKFKVLLSRYISQLYGESFNSLGVSLMSKERIPECLLG